MIDEGLYLDSITPGKYSVTNIYSSDDVEYYQKTLSPQGNLEEATNEISHIHTHTHKDKDDIRETKVIGF